MKGYIGNIEEETMQNNTFRTVLYTTKRSQLVVMAIQPGEEIGSEVHEDHDQFIRLESGSGVAIIDGNETEIKDDFAIVIPAGSEHNVINTGSEVMKLYTIYTPPEHKHGTIHETKVDVVEEHFDGTTSE